MGRIIQPKGKKGSLKWIQHIANKEADFLDKSIRNFIGADKKQVELSKFDEELRHYADMKISLDLDDDVKVNYGKFGKLLAGKSAITGKK